MFLAGADGRSPELRPPSIKGMMRFWWRALHGHLTIEKLKEEEAKIFGASDETIGRSKFSIHVISNKLDKQDYSPLPHSEKKIKLMGIEPNQKIEVKLSTQYDDIDKYSAILKTSLLLGGLGKRARRGFGSIKILNIDKQPYILDLNIEYILKLINNVVPNKYILEKNKIVLTEKNSQRYPFLKEIIIGGQYPSWNELVKTVGIASHNCKDDSLGFVNRNKRLASPIYISVLKISEKEYHPIVSTLNTVFEDSRTGDSNKQKAFKEAIL